MTPTETLGILYSIRYIHIPSMNFLQGSSLELFVLSKMGHMLGTR